MLESPVIRGAIKAYLETERDKGKLSWDSRGSHEQGMLASFQPRLMHLDATVTQAVLQDASAQLRQHYEQHPP
jgi:hypothetical protein